MYEAVITFSLFTLIFVSLVDIAVKVRTQVGISSNLEPANLVFCINLQENTSEKRHRDSSS